MNRSNFLFVFIFLISVNSYANVSWFGRLGLGTSYFNSKGLNKITEGYNAGYVTDFSRIHMPLGFSLGVGLKINKLYFHIETDYEFSIKFFF